MNAAPSAMTYGGHLDLERLLSDRHPVLGHHDELPFNIILDPAFAIWRHKHVLTVRRIIGLKRGTGGKAGGPYVQNTLTKRAFPELWSLRKHL